MASLSNPPPGPPHVAVAGQATVDLIDGICLQLAGADSPLLVLRELLKVLRACAAHRRVVLLLDAAGADGADARCPLRAAVATVGDVAGLDEAIRIVESSIT